MLSGTLRVRNNVYYVIIYWQNEEKKQEQFPFSTGIKVNGKKEEKAGKENSKSGKKTGVILGITALLILGIIIFGMIFNRKNVNSGNNVVSVSGNNIA